MVIEHQNNQYGCLAYHILVPIFYRQILLIIDYLYCLGNDDVHTTTSVPLSTISHYYLLLYFYYFQFYFILLFIINLGYFIIYHTTTTTTTPLPLHYYTYLLLSSSSSSFVCSLSLSLFLLDFAHVDCVVEG